MTGIANATSSAVNIRYYSDGQLDCSAVEQVRALASDQWLTQEQLLGSSQRPARALWLRIERPPQQHAQWLVARNVVDGHLYTYRQDGLALTTRGLMRTTPEDVPGLRSLPLEATADGMVIDYGCLSTGRPMPDVLAVIDLRQLRAEEFWNVALLSLSAGISLMMAALSLGYYGALRERVFLSYVIYVLMLQLYVWHSLRALPLFLPAGLKEPHIGLALGLGSIAILLMSAVRFAIEFTGLERERPQLARFIFATVLCGALCALYLTAVQLYPPLQVLRVQANLALNALALVSMSLMLACAARAAVAGNRAALVYVIGWTPLLLIISAYCLQFLGLLGSDSAYPISPTMLAMASAFESMVLGLALVERARNALRERDEARLAAQRDPLTGLLNRAGFDVAIADDAPVGSSALFFDLDHFKRINDQHGHACGDRVLADFAALVSSQLRRADHVARYGGEEFVAVMPGMAADEARTIAERIGSRVASALPGGLPVTVSIGVAERGPGEPIDAWLARADGALYQAKNTGRARVCVDGQE